MTLARKSKFLTTFCHVQQNTRLHWWSSFCQNLSTFFQFKIHSSTTVGYSLSKHKDPMNHTTTTFDLISLRIFNFSKLKFEMGTEKAESPMTSMPSPKNKNCFTRMKLNVCIPLELPHVLNGLLQVYCSGHGNL